MARGWRLAGEPAAFYNSSGRNATGKIGDFGLRIGDCRLAIDHCRQAGGLAAMTNEPPVDWPAVGRYDGGDLACGQLLLELRLVFRELAAGTVLAVRAIDPGAPLEVPAWCRLTGHQLERAQPPWFLIRKVA
jgi:tRNA 2-thiouridine synthesizing protein A